MGVSDMIASNITTVYLAVIIAVRAYLFVTGQVLGGVLVTLVSSGVVGFLLVATLAWDVACKANKVVKRVDERVSCRGGICWHGVAVRAPASEVRFRIPQNDY